MSCGVCEPEAFKDGGRRFGYVAGLDPMATVRDAAQIMYYGVSDKRLYADLAIGNVRYRKGLLRVRKIARPGDAIVIASLAALGVKPERALRVVDEIEETGVRVWVVPKYRI